MGNDNRKVLVSESNLQDIADSIRSKLGDNDTYYPSQMSGAIDSIPTGQQVEKGLVFSEYDSDGYPHKAEFVGTWTSIPQNFFRDIGNQNLQFPYKITHLDIPEGVTSLGIYSFYNTTKLLSIKLPSTLTEIKSTAFYGTGLLDIEIPDGVSEIPAECFSVAQKITQIVMKGNITKIERASFRANYACDLYDFSNCTSVPVVQADSFDRHKSGCVIKVPQALLSEWQNATNWVALTDVVWEAV